MNLPAAPREVVEVFGSQLLLIERYAELLATDGVERGLIGPKEAPRLWARQILICAAVSAVIPRRAHLADVGSGAGLPGLVVAILRPDLKVTLLEPLLRRTTWLQSVTHALGLNHVEVLRDRAEAATSARGRFDVVTARAVAPLPTLLEWCWPLVRQDGALLAIKGASAATELGLAQAALERRQLSATIRRCGVGVVDQPTVVVQVRAGC